MWHFNYPYSHPSFSGSMAALKQLYIMMKTSSLEAIGGQNMGRAASKPYSQRIVIM